MNLKILIGSYNVQIADEVQNGLVVISNVILVIVFQNDEEKGIVFEIIHHFPNIIIIKKFFKVIPKCQFVLTFLQSTIANF